MFAWNFFHPTVTLTVSEMLRCTKVVGFEYPFLNADFRIQCFDTEWTYFAFIALFVFVTFCFGLPYFFWTLVRRRKAVLDEYYKRVNKDHIRDSERRAALQEKEIAEALALAKRYKDEDAGSKTSDGGGSKVLKQGRAAARARTRIAAEKPTAEEPSSASEDAVVVRGVEGNVKTFAESREEWEETCANVRQYFKAKNDYEKIKFLHQDYDEEFCYWEVVEIARKFCSVTVPGIINQSFSGGDLIFGVVSSFVFFSLHVYAKPYKFQALSAVFIATTGYGLVKEIAVKLRKQLKDFSAGSAKGTGWGAAAGKMTQKQAARTIWRFWKGSKGSKSFETKPQKVDRNKSKRPLISSPKPEQPQAEVPPPSKKEELRPHSSRLEDVKKDAMSPSAPVGARSSNYRPPVAQSRAQALQARLRAAPALLSLGRRPASMLAESKEAAVRIESGVEPEEEAAFVADVVTSAWGGGGKVAVGAGGRRDLSPFFLGFVVAMMSVGTLE